MTLRCRKCGKEIERADRYFDEPPPIGIIHKDCLLSMKKKELLEYIGVKGHKIRGYAGG